MFLKECSWGWRSPCCSSEGAAEDGLPLWVRVCPEAGMWCWWSLFDSFFSSSVLVLHPISAFSLFPSLCPELCTSLSAAHRSLCQLFGTFFLFACSSQCLFHSLSVLSYSRVGFFFFPFNLCLFVSLAARAAACCCSFPFSLHVYLFVCMACLSSPSSVPFLLIPRIGRLTSRSKGLHQAGIHLLQCWVHTGLLHPTYALLLMCRLHLLVVLIHTHIFPQNFMHMLNIFSNSLTFSWN